MCTWCVEQEGGGPPPPAGVLRRLSVSGEGGMGGTGGGGGAGVPGLPAAKEGREPPLRLLLGMEKQLKQTTEPSTSADNQTNIIDTGGMGQGAHGP